MHLLCLLLLANYKHTCAAIGCACAADRSLQVAEPTDQGLLAAHRQLRLQCNWLAGAVLVMAILSLCILPLYGTPGAEGHTPDCDCLIWFQDKLWLSAWDETKELAASIALPTKLAVCDLECLIYPRLCHV